MTRLIVMALLAMHTAMVLAQVAGTNSPLPGTQENLTEGDYVYRTDDAGQATIIAFNKNYSGELLITNSLGGHPVTAIGKQAFMGHVGLTSVQIPDGVTDIGGWAFQGCAGLTSVTIPDSVTRVGVRAFGSCIALTSVMIPDGVTNIGNVAFSGCAGLTHVTVGKGVACIGEMAFSFCSNLVSLTIPASITNIGFRAFSDCTGLTNLPVEAGSTQAARPGNQAYQARRQQRQLQQEQAPARKYTGAELEKHLQDYQMEVIRKGLPAHPIPLTKEMDDQLAKEGVLPAAGGGPYEPVRYKAPTNPPLPKLDNGSETNH